MTSSAPTHPVDPMPIRLAIVRTADALDAWHLRQRWVPQRPALRRGPDLATVGAWETTRAPLDDADPIAATWGRLSAARPLDADLLADVMWILAHTTADAIARPAPPLPDPPSPPARPTAAHPRAYRGTRYTPPTAATPRLDDPRLHLSSPAGMHALCSRLAPFADDAIARLVARGMPSEACHRLSTLCRSHPEPALGLYTPEAPAGRAARWDATFRTVWLPALAGRPGPWLTHLHAWSRRLELAGDPSLSAACLALAIHAEPEAALGWLEQLTALPPGERLLWIQTLLATDLALRPPTASDAGLLLDLRRRVIGEDMPDRIWCLCAYVARGGSAEYLLQGMVLHDPTSDLANAPLATHGIDEAIFWRHLDRTRAEPDDDWRARALWSACGTLPGLTDTLAALDDIRLPPTTEARFAEMLCSASPQWGPPIAHADWPWLRQNAPAMLSELAAVPVEQQLRYIDLIWSVWEADATPDDLDAWLTRVRRLAPHICRTDAPTHHWATDVVFAFVSGLDDARFERIAAADPNGWTHLMTACVDKNAACLIEVGATALCAAVPELIVDAFEYAPKPLWRTARMLGAMRPERSRAVARRVAAFEISTRDWLSWPLPSLCAAISRRTAPGVLDPISRRLKHHLAGQDPLRTGQIDRARRRLTTPGTRATYLLSLLRAAAIAELDPGLGDGPDPGTPAVLHALQVIATIDRNRRILMRVMRAYWSGRPDVVRHHPQTRAWHASHPTLAADVWYASHAMSIDGEDLPSLTLALESDPTEILRLGTYAGSCLGLGGDLIYSAAAVTVDANKRVIYARDLAGRVVARQLVAYSDQGTLVCFEIYPYPAPPAIRRAFHHFDRTFARALGIGIHDDRHGGYDIAHILSHDWWDDAAMDGTSEAPRPGSS